MGCLSVSFLSGWAGSGAWVVPTTIRANLSTRVFAVQHHECSHVNRPSSSQASRPSRPVAVSSRSGKMMAACNTRSLLRTPPGRALEDIPVVVDALPTDTCLYSTVELGRGCFCFWPSPSRAPGHDRLPLGPGRLLWRCTSASVRLSVRLSVCPSRTVRWPSIRAAQGAVSQPTLARQEGLDSKSNSDSGSIVIDTG